MQSLEEHLAAMKRVRTYENRDFQRRVDQYDHTSPLRSTPHLLSATRGRNDLQG